MGDAFRILARVGFVGAQPAVGEDVAHRAGSRLETLARIRGLRLDDVVERQAPFVACVRRAGEAQRAAAVGIEGSRFVVGRSLPLMVVAV